MENEIKVKEQQQAVVTGKSAVRKEVPSATSALEKLKEYGGFAFLENIIDGFSNLNPTRKARRNIFLTDEQWAGERKVLANRLNVWLELLKSGESAEKMRDKAKSKAQSVEELLNKNLHTALNRVHDLETAYRSVALFYKNTESSKVKNVTIVNADMAQLKDLDNKADYDNYLLLPHRSVCHFSSRVYLPPLKMSAQDLYIPFCCRALFAHHKKDFLRVLPNALRLMIPSPQQAPPLQVQ